MFQKSRILVKNNFLRSGMPLPLSHTDIYRGRSASDGLSVFQKQYTSVRRGIRRKFDSVDGEKRTKLDLLWASAEQSAREALKLAVDSFNHLEDNRELSGSAHDLVHDIGAFVAGVFGCDFPQVDGEFRETCKVSLMHRRIGFSVGMTHEIECSICGEDIESCEHLVGHPYPVTVSRDDNGTCSVCEGEACEHLVGEEVQAIAHDRYSKLTMQEVSMTPRPRDPTARLEYVVYERSEVEEHFGHAIAPGVELECWVCARACPGLSESHLDAD